VLDLACGYGHYSRLIKQQGAAQVIGIDISESLIKQARNAEKRIPLGLEYRVQDVTGLGQIGNFDIVTAIYLFPYASTKETLITMCQTIYNNLKPGGRLVAATLNPHVSAADLMVYEQYGVKLSTTTGLQDGAKVTATLAIPDGSVELVAFYWAEASYKSALRQAGFQKIMWHPMRVSEAGMKAFGQDYWQAYLAKPVDIVLECCK
jgi:2-polyprenyl-3-methyl-5-hydroxy-6-metoxy-1,4-benzoquinol methylase